MSDKLDFVLRTLRESVAIMSEAVSGLAERGERLQRLEGASGVLAEQGAVFAERSRQLEQRRICTLSCVVGVSLALCFLILVVTSYLVQR